MKATYIALSIISMKINHISASPLAARADHPITSLSCNRVGWDAGTESFASSSSGGYQACSTTCYADSRCKSFAYTDTDSESPDCQLYTTAVKDNFAEDSESPYIFYDAGCQNASNYCGDSGYYVSRWAISLADTYNYPERQNVAWCYQLCLSWGGYCQSFAWEPYHCWLYNVPVIGNFQSSPQNVGGARAFYDISCPSLKASTTTSTTTTTTTTKIATSTTAKASTKVSTSTLTTTTSRTSSTVNTAPNTTAKATTITTGSATKLSSTTSTKSATMTPLSTTKSYTATSTTATVSSASAAVCIPRP